MLFLTTNIIANTELSLNKEEKDFLSKLPVVKVHMEEDYAPFSFRDSSGKFTGFSVEYADMIAKKLGVKFEYSKDESWSEAIDNLKNGNIDVIAQMVNTKQRQNFANFTKEYMTYFPSLVVKKENEHISSLEDYYGKKVGVVKGYVTEKSLIENFPQIDIKNYKDTQALLNAVIKGDIDAAISTHQVVQYDIISRFISDLISIPILENRYMPMVNEAFGVKKEWPLLASSIQKAIDTLSIEKVQLQIKYFGHEHRPKNSLNLTQKEKEFLDINTVTYCIDPEWEPFEYLDKKGQHNGITKDYLDLISKKTGIKTKLIKTTSWSQTIEYLKDRKCDMIMEMAPTPSRRKYLTFTTPFLKFPQVVAMRSNVSFITGLSDIKNKRIGVIKDYAISEILKLKYPNLKPIEVENVVEGIEKVSNNELDAFIDFLPSLSRGINIVASGNIKIVGKIEEQVNLSIASRNDNPVLSSILQKAVGSFKEEEHKAILDKWMTIKYEYGTDYTLVIKIILISMFFIFLFTYWNYKIKKAHKTIERQNKELEILATTDKLTGIYNRTKLDELLEKEIDRSRRYGRSLGCVIIDIDYFKSVNDNFGHLVGDEVLKQLTALIQKHIRKSDYFGRWGGEEFLMILPEIDKIGFLELLEKIRKIVSEHDIKQVGCKTISIGGTLYKENDTVVSITNRADEALYKAKHTGRDKVVIL